jgi:PilZ domain
MAMARLKLNTPPAAHERRRFQRVKVTLLGRYMLSDRREYPCQVVDMSPGGIALAAPVIGAPGERVIAYVDHLGRLEGTIVRMIDAGFAMTVAATPRKRDKLAAQLTWLANRHILNLPEDRRHGRIIPQRKAAHLKLPSGIMVPCRIIDMSESGCAVAVSPDLRPPVDSAVTIGLVPGRVVREIEDGIAIEFSRLQNIDFLEDNITGE